MDCDRIGPVERVAGMASASLRTALCDLLGCRFPVLSAGMGGVARAELAAAGGFGSLGMVREPPELIAREIGNLRQRCDLDFGVNLIPAATDSVLFGEQMAACRDARVPVMTFFWEVDSQAISEARAFGSTVLYQVGSVGDAIAAEAAGADAVIAQGVEAGGHVRGKVSSLVLLPLVCAAVRIPVVPRADSVVAPRSPPHSRWARRACTAVRYSSPRTNPTRTTCTSSGYSNLARSKRC